MQEQTLDNARSNGAAENNIPKGLKLVAGNTDNPTKKTVLKEKLEIYNAQVAGIGNAGTGKTKGKEAVIYNSQ